MFKESYLIATEHLFVL